MKITIEISERKAREWTYFLSRLYGARKNVGLKKLITMAILSAVVEQAKLEMLECPQKRLQLSAKKR